MNYTDFSQTDFFKYSDFIPDFEQKMTEPENWNYLAKRFDVWRTKYENTKIEHAIPHKIHQIWIGSDLPKKYYNWCKSWQTLNPEWEYKLWQEQDILDLLDEPIKSIFLQSKNFGAKSDIARYVILEKEGGVYCDTDFECIHPLEKITETCTMFAGTIFSKKPEIANGIIGTIPTHPLLAVILEKLKKPVLSEGTDTILNTTGPAFLTRTILENKDKILETDIFFPSHYFYPFPNFCRKEKIGLKELKKKYIKDCTYGIHYWEVSWEKRGFIYYTKKIIKIIILWDLWKNKLNKIRH